MYRERERQRERQYPWFADPVWILPRNPPPIGSFTGAEQSGSGWRPGAFAEAGERKNRRERERLAETEQETGREREGLVRQRAAERQQKEGDRRQAMIDESSPYSLMISKGMRTDPPEVRAEALRGGAC